MSEKYLRTTEEVADAIGQVIAWEVVGRNPHRSGTLLEVRGRNLRVDEDWLWMPNLYNLRIKPAS